MKGQLFNVLLFGLLLFSCKAKKEIAKVPIAEDTIIKKPILEQKKAEKMWGIDVSHYQEIFDWTKIKEQELGFAFVKASEGSTIKDQKYLEFYQKFRSLKIPVGSYHFFTYSSNGKSQAKNFLSIARYQRGDLPLVLDAEFIKKMPDRRIVTRELKDFLATVTQITGCTPIIYCPYNYYLQYIKEIFPAKSKLWIVDYRGVPNCNWTFWQTTEKFKMPGIKGFVDFNQFKGSPEDLKKLLK